MPNPTGSKPVGITLEYHEVYTGPKININDLKLPAYLHTDKDWAPKLKKMNYTVSHGGMLSDGLGNGYLFSTKSVDKKNPNSKGKFAFIDSEGKITQAPENMTLKQAKTYFGESFQRMADKLLNDSKK